jgi:hypothetical protein
MGSKKKKKKEVEEEEEEGEEKRRRKEKEKKSKFLASFENFIHMGISGPYFLHGNFYVVGAELQLFLMGTLQFTSIENDGEQI